MNASQTHHVGEDLTELRQAAIHVLKKLVDAGHVAYFAGGCVRDRLMGLEPADYDIATGASPTEVAKIFPHVQRVGESFGVMLVRIKSQAPHVIQVATFRTEGVYSDGRHPDNVQFTDAQHDASRRDFTINGLFEDPLIGEVIDHVGGKADLEKKILRAIGDPHARLKEDRLRMLRAVRFAARFGLTIETQTAEAIRAGAEQLQGVSRERIGQEIKRMMIDPRRATAAENLQSLGLDQQVLQEDNSRLLLQRLRGLPAEVCFPTALAAWLLDRHATKSFDSIREIASRWSDLLVLSNDERISVIETLRDYSLFATEWSQMGVAKQKRLASRATAREALLLAAATDHQWLKRISRDVEELSRTHLAPPPLIDGSDLINLGLQPGPLFSRILAAVYDSQLERSVQTKSEALAMVRSMAMGLTDR